MVAIINRVKGLKYPYLLCDLGLFLGSALLTLSLTPSASLFKVGLTAAIYFASAAFLRLAVFTYFGVYRCIWRFVSAADAINIVKAVSVSSAIIFLGVTLAHLRIEPAYVVYLFVESIFLIALMGGSRILRRLRYEDAGKREVSEMGRHTLIYGAGVNGRTLASRMQTDATLGLNPIAFIDDDSKKVGQLICGVPVMGRLKDLGYILNKYPIKEMVISISNPPGDLLREVMTVSLSKNIKPRLMADLGPTGAVRGRVELFREVVLDDLINRPKAEMDLESVRALAKGRCVLITGAGGSIGSEIVRQVRAFSPERLLILDSSEYNLYQIDSELRTANNDTSVVVPLLVDIKDKHSLASAMRKYRPSIVFHAAAYKHVHLVEFNPDSSILNNVEGTHNLLELSEEVGVETFVLISSDKAVNPAGIMGATKRVCELMVADAAERTGKRYCAVRFGNVVGSSGSLIPLLKTQISSGGPVTITHKDMTRYFMLIPEAVSLVLKSASICKPGDICILKMGEAIKIVDIAKNLMTLMGKTEEQVPIVFTGARPGEKMHEELHISGDEINTEHPDILVLPGTRARAAGIHQNGLSLWGTVEKMIICARDGNCDSVGVLMSLVSAKFSTDQAPEKVVPSRSPVLQAVNMQTPVIGSA